MCCWKQRERELILSMQHLWFADKLFFLLLLFLEIGKVQTQGSSSHSADLMAAWRPLALHYRHLLDCPFYCGIAMACVNGARDGNVPEVQEHFRSCAAVVYTIHKRGYVEDLNIDLCIRGRMKQCDSAFSSANTHRELATQPQPRLAVLVISGCNGVGLGLSCRARLCCGCLCAAQPLRPCSCRVWESRK